MIAAGGRFNPAQWVLARWQFASVMIALIAALGVSALLSIPRTEDPVLEVPEFLVTAVLPGSGPVASEAQLTRPIEDAVYHLDGVEEVRATSGNDVTTLDVRYRWGTSVTTAFNDLQREMNALRPSLPPGLTRLDVLRFRPSNVALRVVALTSDTLPTRRLDKLARRLRDLLGAIPGVREVKISGLAASRVAVALDAPRLAALGLGAPQVVAALRDAGASAPLGALDAATRRFDVTYAGDFAELGAIRAVTIPTRSGQVVRVGDIAHVGWAEADSADRARFDGHRAALLAVAPADGQDISRLAPLIDGQLAAFQRSLPGGVRLQRGFDQAANVAARIEHLERDFLIALALVSITLLPLGLRAGAVVMLAIPLSLLFGVLVLAALGFTLNQLSIAGFVISLGILVDDAIVVVENITRWLREGHPPREAVVGATRQITLAILGCTACLIFAFIPLTALSDASGAFIRSLPVAVFATVSGSLLVALTAIPLAARVVLRADPKALSSEAGSPNDSEDATNKKIAEGGALLAWVNGLIHRLYAPLLHRALDAPRAWLAGLLALAALAIPVTMVIGTSLFPVAALPQFAIDIDAGEGTPIARTDALARAIEARVRAIPDLVWYSASVGRTSPRLYYNLDQFENRPGFAEVAVGLDRWDTQRGAALFAGLRADFARIPGASISIVEFKQGPREEAPVAIRITGPDLGTLTRLAAAGEAAMHATPGLIDIANPLRRQRTDIRLVTDEAAVAASGVAPGALRSAVQLALTGADPAVLRDADGDGWPVHVSLPTSTGVAGHRIADLSAITVPSATGGAVPLAALAHPTFESGPATINRLDRTRAVTLTANVAPGTLVGRATQAALAKIEREVPLPPGYRLSLGGEAETQARSFGTLGPAILIAAMGILAVLVLEFGRLRSVAVVFGIVPFGFLGAVVALWLTGNSLSFTASIGMIALVGIEIKNSILLVDFTEQLRAEGMSVRAAVERAGELRFLPVLLTSVTAIGGLLPLAIEANGLYSPIAIVLIGGLISSTLLARLATPVMYLLIAAKDRPEVLA